MKSVPEELGWFVLLIDISPSQTHRGRDIHQKVIIVFEFSNVFAGCRPMTSARRLARVVAGGAGSAAAVSVSRLALPRAA